MPRMLLVVVLLVPGIARAERVCSSVNAFNAYAEANGFVATSGELTVRFTGIDPNAFNKAAIANLVDKRANTAANGPCVGIFTKVYGTEVPAEQGKIKDELYNMCCASTDCLACGAERSGTNACETWAGGPPRSPVIFTGPSQTCDFRLVFSPTEQSYSIACDDGAAYDAPGDNPYGLEVNFVSVMHSESGGYELPGTLLSHEFCYERPGGSSGSGSPPVGETLDVPVMEDVSVASAFPSTVVPDVDDLAVSNDVEQAFLKFDLRAVPGTITGARLFLHVRSESWAAGDGASVRGVSDNGWSEETLTYGARPVVDGSGVRMGPVGSGEWVSVDVSGLFGAPVVRSLAVVAEPGDANGVHFDSKEGTAGNAPYLRVTWAPGVPPEVDAGAPEVPDAAVVVELPDAAVVVGMPDASAERPDAHVVEVPGEDAGAGESPPDETDSCACASVGGGAGELGLTLLALAMFGVRRSGAAQRARHPRRERHV